MSDRILPDWIDGFMKYTENSEPPESFRLWTAISVIAAALQRKVYAPWGTLTFYPNMYIVLVAPSGVRKGTAMGPGYNLLDEIGIKMSAQATTLQALIRRLKNTNYTQIDPETGAMHCHSSLTIFSKEFTVFLGYQNKELMANLCDWYDCDSKWTYETKTQGQDEILGLWVNIIGATTPELIHSSMPLDAIGGGLTSRMILVYETRKGKSVPCPIQTKEELEIQQLLAQDLERIHLMAGQFRYSQKFIDRWIEWYSYNELNPPQFNDDRFSGYIHRRPTHLMKLSMIVSASSSNRQVLTQDDFERALEILTKTEITMPRVFSGVGKSPISDLIPRVMAWIANHKEVTTTNLMQNFYHDAEKFTMSRVIDTLESMGFLKRVITSQGEILKYQGKGDPNERDTN